MSVQDLPFSYEELAACMKREAAMRTRVYKKQAGSEPISEANQLEIDKMTAAAAHFEHLAAQPPVRYITAQQRERLMSLLNHPLITRAEKTKMLLAINRLDFDRAASSIANIEEAIELREGEVAV